VPAASERLEETILRFVRTQFDRSSGGTTIEPDTTLFSAGMVDSFGVLELIAFLEEAFHVEIDLSSHDLEDFDTVRKIGTVVRRLLPV
jgi:acyl carrier protein